MKKAKFVLATVIGIILILTGILFFLNYLGIETYSLRLFILGLALLTGFLISKSNVCLYLSFYLLPLGLVLFAVQFITNDLIGISYTLVSFSIGLSFFLTYLKNRNSLFKYLSVILSTIICLYLGKNTANSVYNYIGMAFMLLSAEIALIHFADINKHIIRNFIVSMICFVIGVDFLLRGVNLINQTLFMAVFAGCLIFVGVAIIVYMLYKDKKEI